MYPHTEFEFSLPKGLVDEHGNLHRHGVMRLARARDEFEVLKNQRVRQEPAYESIVRLSQVITVLGDLEAPTPTQLEQLFSIDLAYLQEFYNRINYQGEAHIPVQCPQCQTHFEVELELSGESSATP
ncbi:MAG: phage tail assembly protein [Cyanobacteria bacterium J06627_8]